ncbi:unnamed protein product, partial [Symbiodinium microadriaticum]
MRRALDPCWDCGLGFGQVKRTRSNLSLPWEDPAFQFVVQDRCFLDSLQDTLLSQPDPVPLPQPVSQPAEAQLQPASLPTPKLRALGQWKPQDSQAERQAALSKWSQLFRAVPHLFRPETVSEVVHECSRTELGNLDLRFAKKSTNTLLNRVSSLQRFAAWLLRSFPHEPLSEALVFLYCQNVTSQVTGSSVPDQLSQALNFADSCLGLHVPASSLLSQRVQGLAHQAMRQQRPPRQAPALSTDQVRWLQTLADSDEPQYECYVAMPELDTVNMFLPLVAPAEGICQDDPLLPDLAADGSLLKTNMDADLLKMSSQGLKATCLSWTMKAGIPDPDQAVEFAARSSLVPA